MSFIVVAVILSGAFVVAGAAAFVVTYRASSAYSALASGGATTGLQVGRMLVLSAVVVTASGLVLTSTWIQHKDTESLRDDFEKSDIGGLTREVANLSSLLMSNSLQDSIDKSTLTTHGTQLESLLGTCYVCNNLIENPLYACWDSNEDGLCTLPTEDRNGDGNCTALDCQGVDGHACWDLDADRVCDLLTEDKNNDGLCTVLDCHGVPGTNGTDGTDGNHGSNGSHGYHCWDLNENRLCDLVTEDVNKDGNCTVADCVHYANGSIELVNAQGAYIDFKLLDDTDYDVRLQQVQNGFHFSTGGSGNTKLGMVLDANGRLGIGTQTPSYDVHVVDDTTGYNQIRVHSNHTQGRAGISLYQNSASSDFVMQHSTLGAGFLHNRGGNLTIMADSLHLFSNEYPQTEAIHIASSGAIGFGTKHSGVYPYKFGGTVYAPTVVSSITTTSTISSQTSGLALQSGTTPGAGAEISLFGDGAQSNSAFHDAGYHKFRGLNGAVGSGKVEVYGNDEALRLIGVDHVYSAWYKDGIGGGRSAWMGYGGAGQSLLQIVNDVSGGGLNLATSGGTVFTNSPLDVTHTAEQLWLRYDGSNYATFTVDTNGHLEIAPVGSRTEFTGNADWVYVLAATNSATDGFGGIFQSKWRQVVLVYDPDPTKYVILEVQSAGELVVAPTSGHVVVNGKATLTATASEQLRLAYDASNYATFQVDANGHLHVTKTGSDMYTSGNIYHSGPILATHTSTPQFWARYDGSNYMTIQTFNGGAVNFDAVGTGTTYFVFKDSTYIEGALHVVTPITQTSADSATLRIGGITTGDQSAALDAETVRHRIVFSSFRDSYPDTLGAKIEAINYAKWGGPAYLVQFTDLVFSTLGQTPTGPDSTTERMRINNQGKITNNANVPSDYSFVTINDQNPGFGAYVRSYDYQLKLVYYADVSKNAEFRVDGGGDLAITPSGGDTVITGEVTTTGAVNHVSTHPLPNGGSARWIWLGQLSAMDQGGRSLTIHIVSNVGYHPNDYEDYEVFIRFKTFNEPSSGRRFSVNYYSTGMHNAFSSGVGSRVAVTNSTLTVFDFYIYLDAYCGENAYYTVQHNYAYARWAHTGTDTNPPAGAYYAPSWYVVQSNSIINADLSVNGNVVVTSASTTPVHIRSTQNGVTMRLENDARAYSIKVRDVGTGDDRFIIADETAFQERIYMDSSGDVTFNGHIAVGTTVDTNYHVYTNGDMYSNGGRLLAAAGTGEQLKLMNSHGGPSTTFTVNSGGDLSITPSGGDLTVNGNIAVTGTVDGVDLSALPKLASGSFTGTPVCVTGCSGGASYTYAHYLRIGGYWHVSARFSTTTTTATYIEVMLDSISGINGYYCVGTATATTNSAGPIGSGRFNCASTSLYAEITLSSAPSNQIIDIYVSGIMRSDIPV